ncbi:TPA: hypothetical protein MFC29_003330 [Klebsiella pneumoniae]|nr:hypothetical protein [Klebsiella pneumoniae]
MAKNSIEVYGASGKTNVLTFEPEHLHLITDKTHPLYDERVHLPIDEGMVLNIKELGVLEPIIVWKDPETGLTCVVAELEEQVKSEHACKNGIHLFDKAGQRKLDALSWAVYNKQKAERAA